MLILLSPAKIMNFKSGIPYQEFTMPAFMEEANYLIGLLRDLSPGEIGRLLDINSNLVRLNFDRIFNWHQPFTPENAKQAALAFDGEVFRGLNAKTFSEEDFKYAQEHLRILSGLYGVLRPLDLIQAYRLEVSSRLQNSAGNDLYAFWKEKVTNSIVEALQQSGEPQVVLNLASSEYFKTLNLKNTGIRVIDIEFYEYKQDRLKQIVIYTKKARGLMSRFVIQNKIENIDDLKGFSDAGYWYSPQNSTENKMVFIR